MPFVKLHLFMQTVSSCLREQRFRLKFFVRSLSKLDRFRFNEWRFQRCSCQFNTLINRVLISCLTIYWKVPIWIIIISRLDSLNMWNFCFNWSSSHCIIDWVVMIDLLNLHSSFLRTYSRGFLILNKYLILNWIHFGELVMCVTYRRTYFPRILHVPRYVIHLSCKENLLKMRIFRRRSARNIICTQTKISVFSIHSSWLNHLHLRIEPRSLLFVISPDPSRWNMP